MMNTSSVVHGQPMRLAGISFSLRRVVEKKK
jgi:hypothetical protein